MKTFHLEFGRLGGFLLRLMFTRAGWWYILMIAFIAAGAARQQINLMILLWALMIPPLVINLWFSGSMLSKIRVTRHLPWGVCAGDPFGVELEVTSNRRYFSVRGVSIFDPLQWEISKSMRSLFDYPGKHTPLVGRVHFASIPAHKTCTASYRGVLMHRGRYRLGPMTLRTEYPFGLVRYRKVIPETAELLVYPQLGTISSRWKELQRRRQEELSHLSQTRFGQRSGEFHSLRDYQTGDSFQWIHWKTSARLDRLVVRQFEQPHGRDTFLLVIPWIPENPEPIDYAYVERALSFTASMARDITQQGSCQLGLGIASTKPEFLLGPTSQTLLRDIFVRLAVAEADPEFSLKEYLRKYSNRIGSNHTLIVVTTKKLHLPELETVADPEDIWHLGGLYENMVQLIVPEGDLDELFSLDGRLSEDSNALLTEAGV
ncbi:Hypothetical protein PBC10988_17230 [Planctomycetales bacterium 10988]|nr:Hypothetical protein PBC10988_17230 [Planctomycetales bacterium 10988]